MNRRPSAARPPRQICTHSQWSSRPSMRNIDSCLRGAIIDRTCHLECAPPTRPFLARPSALAQRSTPDGWAPPLGTFWPATSSRRPTGAHPLQHLAARWRHLCSRPRHTNSPLDRGQPANLAPLTFIRVESCASIGAPSGGPGTHYFLRSQTQQTMKILLTWNWLLSTILVLLAR